MRKLLLWLVAAAIYIFGAFSLYQFQDEKEFGLNYILYLIPTVVIITTPVLDYWYKLLNKWFGNE